MVISLSHFISRVKAVNPFLSASALQSAEFSKEYGAVSSHKIQRAQWIKADRVVMVMMILITLVISIFA